MAPVWLHIYSNGNMYISKDPHWTPGVSGTGSSGKFIAEAGTLVGVWRIGDASAQKIGTLSGTVSSSLSATGTTGKFGKEIS